MVVPIFAPMIKGTAWTKEIFPEATIATIIAVIVELLCRSAVINKPTKSPMKGFFVAWKNAIAKSLFSLMVEAVSKSMDNMKSTNAKNICEKVKILFGGGETSFI